MKKYNKPILKELSLTIFNDYYKLYVLDDTDYYNIHIICNYFKDEELNTLYLQEPKQDININDIDELYMTKTLLEFALWNKFYGYKDKSYSFSINTVDEIELKEI
jgi:hypothetical protein